jgi:hypothetical protein
MLCRVNLHVGAAEGNNRIKGVMDKASNNATKPNNIKENPVAIRRQA